MTVAQHPGRLPAEDASTLPRLFQPLTLRDLTLRNRLVVSPMCQYSCEAQDGLATDWHLVHLGSRAVGGAGLVFTEAAAVTPEGRISPQDLGFWSDAHAQALAPIVRFLRAQGAATGIQLAHAGRKASTLRPWDAGTDRRVAESLGGWAPIAPSSIPFAEGYHQPRAMDLADIRAAIAAFATAARRAHQAGFDVVEVHAAHGYLLHEFLSPLSNRRTDAYGGSFQNRQRLLLEVVEAVRGEWPADKALMVRISATDWVPGGWDLDDSVRLVSALAQRGVDLVDCSSGGVSPLQQIPTGPGYQVPLAERIRRETGLPTGAVGLITDPHQAEAILSQGQADLVFMAREFLRQPYLPLHAAAALGAPDAVPWPSQYLRAR